ncbi:MAG: hypothetical protein GXP56_10460 [Deltaproteobacteria bacterium]|nr:hypothetical protein [Deltaproteobacteria bacterium]
MKISNRRIIFWLLWIGISAQLFSVSFAKAADKENCLMCHKYRSNARIDETGKKRNFHVNEKLYNRSVHRNISCRDCHTYITKIPHDPVTQKVNCANQCHIRPPFAQEKFSHKKIIDLYNESAHGVKPDDPQVLKDALPNCKFCHLNPLYTKISEKRVAYKETLARCYNCHPESGVIMAYKHITHRLRKRTSRSSRKIVKLCTKCHGDNVLMKKLNVSKKALRAVDTYNRSVHGKLVRLGSQKAANCINCHASSALHDINKRDNKKATINKDNIMQVCRQCHKNADQMFINIAVHPEAVHSGNPIIKLVSISLGLGMYGSVLALVGLLLLETLGRRKDGARLLLKRGTIWYGKQKSKSPKNK